MEKVNELLPEKKIGDIYQGRIVRRAVAYFDVLGFKNKIETMPALELAKQYENILALTDGYAHVDENHKISFLQSCERFVFSDSILMVAKDDTEEAFIDFISYIWRVMQLGIASGFCLRGAITYGEIYCNSNARVFLGQPIVDAVMLEGEQNWCGAVIANSAIGRYSKVFEMNYCDDGLIDKLFPLYLVPLKNAKYVEYRVINWRCNMIVEFGLQKLFIDQGNDTHVEEINKNTLVFAKTMRDKGYNKMDSSSQRYNVFYILGKKSDVPVSVTDGDEY